MSQFFESLWNSIFTPGPTPTLLVATNASFAALQVVLFALLLATYSIHFVVLSGLCAGLWWSINWFANELRQAQEKEEAAKKIRERRDRERERSREADDLAGEREPAVGRDGGEGEGMDTGDDTETETETEVGIKKSARAAKPGNAPAASSLSGLSVGPTASSTTGAQTSLAPVVDDALKKRRSLGEGAESSTDSEWEKIEQER
ncbi:SMK killer toxin resistance protein [Neofusicoccum ribis]|uniref:SMK killer toxin resistance protein n=1 Tax=Neofusicoccum ribis TaxID=45134 RepID=A0ABR3SIU2_9PEZI